MKIALVDDEQCHLDEMALICHRFGETNDIDLEIYLYTNGESFIASLDKNIYSIVFMDIFMDGTDGIEISKKLRERDSGCILIFLTSCNGRMPDAFSCHAFEYILKPFDHKRVTDVLFDALKLLPVSKYIDVYSGKKTVRLMYPDIAYAVSDAHYLCIGLTNGEKLRCRMTAGEFAEQTGSDKRFISVNKGIIVNADLVTGFDNNCCVLEGGVSFPIRVRDRLSIEQAVRDYNFGKIRSRQRHGG